MHRFTHLTCTPLVSQIKIKCSIIPKCPPPAYRAWGWGEGWRPSSQPRRPVPREGRSGQRWGGFIVVNPFLPTVPPFAVRETDASRHNGGTSGAPLKPLRDDSALRALLTQTT